MLTGKLVRVRFGRDRIIPIYLSTTDEAWLEIAERLRGIYRGAEGKTRGDIEDELLEFLGADPSHLVHQGLAKLLEDRCEFEVVSGQPPEQLREAVFLSAAVRRTSSLNSGNGISLEESSLPRLRSSVADERHLILQEVAKQWEMTPEAVDQGLFADLKSEQRRARFKDITAARLLERYNVALAQAVLLRSTRVRVSVRGETPARYRQLLRALKFHRLLCEVSREKDAYTFELDGPLSLFSATQKYGLQLALFLPAVLLCRDFDLRADLCWGPGRKPKQFTLSTAEGLVSHYPDTGRYVPPEMAMFVELFRKKIRDWDISDETDIVPLGDHFWVPDYRLIHKETGKAVLLEVLGFWRRASAQGHLERLRRHAPAPFLLAVSDQLHVDDAGLEDLPAGIHRFRNMPLPDEIARLASEV